MRLVQQGLEATGQDSNAARISETARGSVDNDNPELGEPEGDSSRDSPEHRSPMPEDQPYVVLNPVRPGQRPAQCLAGVHD